MDWRQVTRALVKLAIILVVASPAAAQQPPGTAAADGPAGDVSLTYGILHFQEETSAVGFGLAVAKRVLRSSSNHVDVQIVGELGANYFSASDDFEAATQTSFMAGVRFVGRGNPKASPFAQLLAGGIHCCGETDLAASVGAGVDVPMARSRANLRLQLDVPVAYYKAGVDADGVPYEAGRNVGFRFSVGVSVPLGK